MATKVSVERKRAAKAAAKLGMTYPMCRDCNWRKGGVDSWDGFACKCGHTSAAFVRCGACQAFVRCGACHGLGTVPYGLGNVPCTKCNGSGLW